MSLIVPSHPPHMPLAPTTADLPLFGVETGGLGTDGLAAAPPGPPGMLLHPGGPTDHPPPAFHPRPATEVPLEPDRALDLDAGHLVRLLARPTARPSRWPTPAFAREVELVRSHLRPIRTRGSLCASFGREAFHGLAAPGTDRALGASAVRVAYALRWLELGDDVARPSWPTLLDGDGRT